MLPICGSSRRSLLADIKAAPATNLCGHIIVWPLQAPLSGLLHRQHSGSLRAAQVLAPARTDGACCVWLDAACCQLHRCHPQILNAAPTPALRPDQAKPVGDGLPAPAGGAQVPGGEGHQPGREAARAHEDALLCPKQAVVSSRRTARSSGRRPGAPQSGTWSVRAGLPAPVGGAQVPGGEGHDV